MFKPYNIIISLFFIVVATSATYGQAIITLDQPESGNQVHRATEKVRLLSGYAYQPVGTEKMKAYIGSIFNFTVDATPVGQEFTTYYISGMGVNGDFYMQTSDTFELSALDTTKLLTINFTDTNQVNSVAITITFNENNQIETAVALITDESDTYEYSIMPYLSVGIDNIIFDLNELIINHVSRCIQYDDYHWLSNKLYNENGWVISEGVTYLDNIGRPIQSQARNFSTNKIMAKQSIYDSFGRLAINTLSAPIYNGAFCYKSNFITANSGDPYDVSKFDLPNTSSALSGEIDNPFAVDNTTKGTLGWYFSNNNDEESYVASSGFPYSRVEYYSDPLGRPKRIAGISENFKLGSGHETTVFYGVAGNELTYVYGYAANNFNNYRNNLTKTILTNADGLEQVVYTDAQENVIATCYSGIENDCYTVPVQHKLDYYKGRSVNIHLPYFATQQLTFNLNTARGCSDIAYVTIKIVDLMNEKELVSGVDYNFVQTPITGTYKYPINFIGNYANKSLYLSISYDYTAHYINNVYPVRNYGPYLPYQAIQYKLDYSHWTLNYYDYKSRLVKTIPPEGVDCRGIDPNIAWDYETDWVNYDFYDYQTDVFTINPGNYVDNIYNYYDYKTTNSTIYTSETTQNHDIELTFYPSQKNIGYLDCDNLGSFDDIGYDDNSQTLVTVNNILDFMEKNTTYSNSRIMTSIDTTDIDSFNMRTANRVPVLVQDGIFIGDQNFKVLTGDGFNIPLDVDPGPCSGHCFNGIQDCGETGVDIGPDCIITPPPPCEGIPPVLLATYKMEIEVIIEDATTAYYVKNDGSVQSAPYSYYFYPKIYKTCNCEYYWDYSSFSTLNITINNQELNTYKEGIHFNLKSVQVRKEQQLPNYEAFNDADWIHHLLQYMDLRVRLKHNVGPYTNDNISHSLISAYEYDELNQLVAVETPDEGVSESVYDTQGKTRFTQNAQQKIEEKFSYVNYDRAGRPIESGIYDYSNSAALQFQNQKELPALNVGETSVLTVVDETDGLNDTYCSEQTFTLYDLPDESTSPYYPFNTAPYTNYKQTHLLGRVSKTWNEFSIMWYGYDMYGRVAWTIEYILDAAIADYKTINYEYDAAGNVSNTIYQKYDTEYFEHQYTYDAGQQLKRVQTSINGVIYYNEATYAYYQHGPLKRTEIGDQLQGVDYVYTIDGKLKTINSPNLGEASGSTIFYDPGKDGEGTSSFNTDIFGMVIDYHQFDYERAGTHINFGLGTNQKYTGTINQVRWNLDENTLGLDLTPSGKQNVYQYTYNEFNWLTGATFGEYTPSCSQNTNPIYNCPFPPTFTADVNNQFKVSDITYDKNGNLATLIRNGNTTTGTAMDNLTYNYATITQPDNDVVKINNRLTHVTDAVAASGYTTDITTQSANNYTYNAIGELVADAAENKTYTYYQNGLAKAINTGSNATLKFEYNANGHRLKKYIYNSSGVLDKEVFYIRDAGGNVISTYEKEIATSNIAIDYSIIGNNLIGMFNPDPVSLESRYFMYDHLGNVRATFRENGGAPEVLSVNEFYPFGMNMPGRTSISSLNNVNYGYQGQELDQTGLNFFPLRMYDARLGRWLRTDPYYQHHSPYLAMSNNPISFVDPTGGVDENNNGIDDNDEDIFASAGYYAGTNWMDEFINWYSGLEASIQNEDKYVEYLTELSRVGEAEIRRRVFRDVKEVWIVDPNTKWLYGGVKELQVNYSTRYHLKFRKPTFGGTSADDFDYSLRARGRRGGSDLFAQVGGDGDGGVWKSFNTNYRQFQRGFDAGFLGGIKSTGNFFLSLRTEQGWKDVGMGIYNTAMISCQACPQGIPLRLSLENAIINYVDNIPNMSWYEMGYDAGFGVEKGIEFWLTRNAFPVSKVSLGLRNGFGKASRYTNRFSLSLKGQLGQTSFKIYTPINGMGISTHDFGIGLSRNILTPSGYATGFGFGQYLQQK